MVSKLKEIADENKKRIIEIILTHDKGDGVTWHTLLEKTGFAKATLAKHLKRLIDEGLIVEIVDRKDRRIKRYKINEKGFEALKNDLVGFLLYVAIKNAIESRIIYFQRQKLKDLGVSTPEDVKPEHLAKAFDYGDVLYEDLVELFGKMTLESLALGGDYLKIYCRVLDLIAHYVYFIPTTVEGKFKFFGEYVIKKTKVFQETAGRLKVEDLKTIADNIKEVFKKDLLFTQNICSLLDTLIKEVKREEDRKDLEEHLELVKSLAELYERKINESPFLRELYKIAKDEIEKEYRGTT